MAEREAMSPEVRELLGELAGDDTARLLRVGRKSARREAHERLPRVATATPFLKKAERRLLEVHREELARLLYRYAVLIREGIPAIRARVHYGDARPLPSRSELDRRATEALQGPREGGGGGDAEALSLLRSCLTRTGDPRPLGILAAAARLAPSTSIRIMQGTDLLSFEDDLAGCERVLSAVLEAAPPAYLASYAWENLGTAAVYRGDFRVAAQRYQMAVRTDRIRKVPKLTWLRFAFLSGSRADTLLAAKVADAELSPEDPAVRWYHSLTELGNHLMASGGALRLRRELDDQLGTIARMITHDGLEES